MRMDSPKVHNGNSEDGIPFIVCGFHFSQSP
jgi:hypothetical protein